VHTLADEIRILEDHALIAAHPVWEVSHQHRYRAGSVPASTPKQRHRVTTGQTSEIIVPRSLAFYNAASPRLAREHRP